MPAEYTIRNNQFSLKHPEGWEDRTVYYIDGPFDNDLRHSIVVVVEHNPVPNDLVRYAELKIRAVEQTLQGYHELKRGMLTLDNQLPAYEIVFKWCPVESIKQYKRVIYVLANDTGYTLSATFTKKTWKIRGGEVDKMLRSFSVPGFGIAVGA